MNNDDFARVAQATIQMNQKSGTLQFDASEFARGASTGAVNPTQVQEVSNAVKNLYENAPMMKYASSMTQIAAQFKNVCLKSSALTPEDIEVALTHIIDSFKTDAPVVDPNSLPFTLTYSTGGSYYGAGVRVFTFNKKWRSVDYFLHMIFSSPSDYSVECCIIV